MAEYWDAVVVGGGGAGLAAALTLVRARRRTLLVDDGRQRNRFAPHSHGVLGFDGTAPGELVHRGRDEVVRYGGVLRHGAVTAVRQDAGGFVCRVEEEDEVAARQVVVATGVRDELPPVPGVEEQWGTGVVVCPYCDGWESRDRRIGILGTGPKSIGQALLLRQWSDDVVLLPNHAVALEPRSRAAFAARGIRLVEGAVEGLLVDGGALRGVRVDGRTVGLDRIFTAPRAVPNDGLLRGLDVARGPSGDLVAVDHRGATSLPGLWAVGNAVHPSLKVPTAVGNGMAVGAEVNEALVEQDLDRALAAVQQVTRA